MKKLMSHIMSILTKILIIVGIALVLFGGKEFVAVKFAENGATKSAISLLKQAEVDKPELADFEPEFGEAIGMLTIGRIDADLPIVQGVHEDDLKKGVGHYTGTSYPLDDDQIVLSGHRDTVFRRMGELEIGDIMSVHMPYGKFDYEIIETKIVAADDLTIIVPHDEEILTVTTCYPFSFIGNAPDRYIINAKPIYDESEYAEVKGNYETNQ